MKKTIFKYITIAFAVLLMLGCNQLDELTKRVDELESKVNAALVQVDKINANIEALQALAEATTINKVEEKDGVYTITLSNGEKLTLNQGAVGVGNAPVMSIDKDGYWMVDYGEGAEYLLVNGEKVKARGENGAAPQFGVNADGNWTVSYNGSEPKEVLGADGKPVSAVNGDASDPYFNDVSYKDGKFTLTLKDGSVIELPIVPDFLFAIKDAEGEQVFEAGKSKVYTVEQKGIAMASIIAYPAGWKAELDETTLTVTAPMATKVAADTETDIAVLAISGKGFSTIAKIKVKLDGAVVITTPVASVSVGEATSSSLVYNVTLKNAVAYKYIHKLASEPAPTAGELAATGTECTGNVLLIEGLDAATEYALYVLPYDNEKHGDVVKTTHKTAAKAFSSMYEKYMAGETITIAGVDYSKDVYGDAVLLSADAADLDIKTEIHQKDKAVLFLDAETAAGAFALLNITDIKGDIVIVGNKSDKNVVLRVEGGKFFKLISGRLVFANLDIDMTSITNYIVNQSVPAGGDDFGALHFENCNFKNVNSPVMATATASVSHVVKSLKSLSCSFEIVKDDNLQLFNYYTTTVIDNVDEFIFDNNIVYAASTLTKARIQPMNWGENTAQSGASQSYATKVSLSHNTFYNVPGANPYLKFNTLASLTIKDNIFTNETDKEYTCCLTLLKAAGYEDTKTVFDISGNVCYGLTKNFTVFHSNSTYKWATGNTLVKEESDPLSVCDTANGIFTPSSAYQDKGARR